MIDGEDPGDDLDQYIEVLFMHAHLNAGFSE